MSKILVTGVDGQVGCRLARQLLSKNYEVWGTILNEPPYANRLKGLNLELMTGDLTDPAFAAYAVDGVDAVLHTANLVRADAFENNILATFNVVKASAARANALHGLVYVSSSAVYPNDSDVLACEYHPVDERHPCRPIGAYPLSKLIGEETVWAFARASGLAASIIRPSCIVSGDGVLEIWSVSSVCGTMRKGANHLQSELYAPEAGEPWKELRRRATSDDQPCAVTDLQGRSWVCQLVDARDVAHGILCALESNAARGEMFNISALQPIPYTEAAAILAELTATDVLEYRAPVRWVYDLDNTKARSLIGYAPKWGIRDMIEDALAFRQGKTDGLM